MASTTTFLTGHLPFILFLAAVLALPTSLYLLRLYCRAVERSMHLSANSGAAQPELVITTTLPQQAAQRTPALVVVDQTTPTPAAGREEALYSELLNAPCRSAAVYVAAGLGYAFVMALSFVSVAHQRFLPLSFLIQLWIYAWPVVLMINLVTAVTPRVKVITLRGYFVVLPVLGILAFLFSPTQNLIGILLLWLIANVLPTVLLMTFLSRGARAVGPLVLIFLILGVGGSWVTGLVLGLGRSGASVVLIVVSFAAFGLAGWLTLQWIKTQYLRKKINDRSISLDALWLLFGFVQSIILVFQNPLLILSGFLGFLVYKVIVRSGLSRLSRQSNPAHKDFRLLLLRVFSLGKRSEQLFDVLAEHWRHVGSIQLIAGPDLATTTVEPHDFLDFLSGKLARSFIDGREALDLRISEMDVAPDRDGRFRINDFFCHADTWKMVLSRLVSESDTVLMDLRGFAPQNAGCIFEINELINVMPLERVVFIIDDTTDEKFLSQKVQEMWNQMSPASPNRVAASKELRVFRFRKSPGDEIQQLLSVLSHAANAGKRMRAAMA